MLNMHNVYFDSIFHKSAIIKNNIFCYFPPFKKCNQNLAQLNCLFDVVNKSLKQHFVLPNFEESFYMFFVCLLNLILYKQFDFLFFVSKKASSFDLFHLYFFVVIIF